MDMSPRRGPLHGIRVIDLTRVIAGPFSAMLLADLGADVIKIESPGKGDQTRHQGGGQNGLSWYFASFNRNKRAITLDMRSPEGLNVLKDLLRQADVLVENFRPLVLEKMGLSQEVLAELNPRLIVCSISGYGQHGPYRDRPAFDFIAQALSGFMSANGNPEDKPLRSGLPISDLVAGLYAALAVTAALVKQKDPEAKGERIDVALVDSIMSFGAYFMVEYLATGQEMARGGNDHPVVAPYGLYTASDGDLAIAPSNDLMYERLVTALEMPELLSDPRFSTNADRMANRTQINALISERLAKAPRSFWIERLNGAGVPCGRVHSFEEAVADPQAKARDMILTVPHPGRGDVRMLGFPMKLKQSPCILRHPAPEMGAHSRELLDELGYSAERKETLLNAGVVVADQRLTTA